MGLVHQVKGRVASRLYGVADGLPWRRRLLLEPYRAIYIPIPKVACTSFKTAFAALLGIDLERAGGDPHRVRYPSPWPLDALSESRYRDFYRFAFVRNPWDRLVSCYRDKIRNEVGGEGHTHFSIRPGVANCLARFDAFEAGMSFEAFVAAVASIPDSEADEHFRSQHTFVSAKTGALDVDFIGRYERLADDFQIVRERTGLPDVELPRLQAAGKKAKYVGYYTPQTRDVVARRYERDIAMFSYDFGG